MLKLKILLLSSFIISLFLFISCTDNPINGNKGLLIKGQTGKELCTTCLTVFVIYEDETPVPDADVKIKFILNNTVYLRGTTNSEGIVDFSLDGLDLPKGNWVATAEAGIYLGVTYFTWDGKSGMQVYIILQ
jgi:hypothetical protein